MASSSHKMAMKPNETARSQQETTVNRVLTAISESSTNAKIIALAGTALVGSFYYWQKIKPRIHPSIPPLLGDDEWDPLLGHFGWFIERAKDGSLLETMSKLLNETHSDKRVVSLGGPRSKYFHFMTDPKLIKWVFTDAYHAGTLAKNEPDLKERTLELIGKSSIFAIDGEEWRFHRKVASRMFSMRNLKNYMYECAVSASVRAIAKLKELSADTGDEIDLNDMLGRFTLDSFIEIAFGKSLQIIESAPVQHAFGLAFDELGALVLKRPFDPIWRLKKKMRIGTESRIAELAAIVDKFATDLVELEKRKQIIDEGGEGHDLLSLYLKHDKKGELSYEVLKGVAQSFIIAGRDTTRMLLSWFFFEMSRHKEIFTKVEAEIMAIESCNHRSVTTEMDFTEKCLLETLRLWPSVWLSRRSVQVDSLILPGPEKHVVRKWEMLWVLHSAQGRNPKIFKDPLAFHPNRWTNGLKTFDESEYVVFNQSPRICLGRQFALLEAKIFVWHFVKAFTYRPVNEERPEIEFGAILNMKHGYPVSLSNRQEEKSISE